MRNNSIKKIYIYIALLIISIIFVLVPSLKLWSAINIAGGLEANIRMDNIYDDKDNIEFFRSSKLSDHYSSENFEFYISKDYMTSNQVHSYINWIEDRYLEVLKIMEHEKEINSIEKKITIYIVNSSGTSYCGGLYIVLYDLNTGLNVSVHEMTHALDFKLAESIFSKESNNRLNKDFTNLFFEQRAVFIEDQLGSGMAFPNYGLPIEPMIYARIRNGNKLESLEVLNNKTLLMEEGKYDQSEFRYIMAGSFGRYLIDTYGITNNHKIMSSGYLGAYGKSLAELEQEWLDWIEKGSVLQNLVMFFSALLMLGLAHYWIIQKGKHFWIILPVIIAGTVAFLAWGYYLDYTDNDLWGLVIVITAGALVKIWRTKIGIITLWISSFILLILPLLDSII